MTTTPLTTSPSGDVVPRPDPTVLTTAALNQAVDQLTHSREREMSGLREIFEGKLGGQRDAFEARLRGMDEAIRLLQTIQDRFPDHVDVNVRRLEALHDQRFQTVEVQFQSVQTQFAERDVRGRDAALANTTAVNAALQAQKEAAGEQAKSFTLSIDKSEKGTLEQIAQQRVLLETMKQTLDGKVEDVKERLTRIEGLAAGALANRTETVTTRTTAVQGNSFMLALFVAGISLAGLILLVIRDFAR